MTEKQNSVISGRLTQGLQLLRALAKIISRAKGLG